MAFAIAGGRRPLARSHVSPDSGPRGWRTPARSRGPSCYWRAPAATGRSPSPSVVSFLDAHERASSTPAPRADDARRRFRTRGFASPTSGPAVEEAEIDAFLARADLPPGVGLLGRYWRGVVRDAVDDDVERDVVHRGGAEPPLPCEPSARRGRAPGTSTSTRRQRASCARGPLRRPERAAAGDVDAALSLWADAGAWNRIDQALSDPRVAAHADPWLQLRQRSVSTTGSAPRGRTSAVSRRRSRSAPRCSRRSPRSPGGPSARGSASSARVRASALPLYFAAFVLGFLSVSLTLGIVALEEGLLQMTESGPAPRRLFFTFGVGLREEGSKLLFFAPLLPILHRKGHASTSSSAGRSSGSGSPPKRTSATSAPAIWRRRWLGSSPRLPAHVDDGDPRRSARRSPARQGRHRLDALLEGAAHRRGHARGVRLLPLEPHVREPVVARDDDLLSSWRAGSWRS